MRIRSVVVGMLATVLGSCSSPPPLTPEEEARAWARLDQANCAKARDDLTLAYGEQSLAEWDISAADNLDTISPEQEAGIRASLGREMGLAPSQVNGWRDIYRGRAEEARRRTASRRATIERLRADVDAKCQDIGSGR